jgi:glycosyltransferase involved in cell wall biosynthesis
VKGAKAVKRPVQPRAASVSLVRNATAHLPRVVPAAQVAAEGGGGVDVGSSDATAKLAEQLGARLIRLRERACPARARNVGAAQVNSDVVLFVDSDRVVHADVAKRVHEAIATDPGLTSIAGLYDSEPSDPAFFSRYMNLRYRFTRRISGGEKATFRAGCQAVQRRAFLEVGGFGAERFPHPQIEDIELGLRLAKHGVARLGPELQVKHLKRWTLSAIVATKIRHRAIPWSRLVLESGELPNNLNLRLSQRAVAALSPVALTAEAWLFHQVHLVYGTATSLVCFLLHRLHAL